MGDNTNQVMSNVKDILVSRMTGLVASNMTTIKLLCSMLSAITRNDNQISISSAVLDAFFVNT